jgi:hypothetical protein
MPLWLLSWMSDQPPLPLFTSLSAQSSHKLAGLEQLLLCNPAYLRVILRNRPQKVAENEYYSHFARCSHAQAIHRSAQCRLFHHHIFHHIHLWANEKNLHTGPREIQLLPPPSDKIHFSTNGGAPLLQRMRLINPKCRPPARFSFVREPVALKKPSS